MKVLDLAIQCWNINGIFTNINGFKYSKFEDPLFDTEVKKHAIFGLVETHHTSDDIDKLQILGFKYSRDCGWPRRPWPNAGRRGKSRENYLFFWGGKKLPKKNIFFLHISSTYAKIMGETDFHTLEFPRSGSKAKDGEKERKRDRPNDGYNNGQLCIATFCLSPQHRTWKLFHTLIHVISGNVGT